MTRRTTNFVSFQTKQKSKRKILENEIEMCNYFDVKRNETVCTTRGLISISGDNACERKHKTRHLSKGMELKRTNDRPID